MLKFCNAISCLDYFKPHCDKALIEFGADSIAGKHISIIFTKLCSTKYSTVFLNGINIDISFFYGSYGNAHHAYCH